jgi:hypothetical protein
MLHTESAVKTDTSDGLTSLANAIKNIDRTVDSRQCRATEDCHGTLRLTDDDEVVCTSCQCKPDGTFILPPAYQEQDTSPEQTVGHAVKVERYYNSDNVILPGGYEAPYDEDDDERPNSVGDEYTYDLTLSA